MRETEIGKLSVECRVIFGDTDSGGVVYHPRYLEMAERGRNEVMRHYGLDVGELFKEGNIGLALRSASMKFHSPAFFDDNLIISTKLRRLSAASSEWVSVIRRGGTQICTVKADIICMDRATKDPIIYPQQVQEAFAKCINENI